jgi:hypothetical protein
VEQYLKRSLMVIKFMFDFRREASQGQGVCPRYVFHTTHTQHTHHHIHTKGCPWRFLELDHSGRHYAIRVSERSIDRTRFPLSLPPTKILPHMPSPPALSVRVIRGPFPILFFLIDPDHYPPDVYICVLRALEAYLTLGGTRRQTRTCFFG